MLKLKLKSSVGAMAALLLCIEPASAADRRGANYFQEDFPFQGACISARFPAGNVALKGYAIRVGHDANMLWDTDLLRFAAGWTGGYISGNGVVYNGSHGQHPAIVGTPFFGTKQGTRSTTDVLLALQTQGQLRQLAVLAQAEAWLAWIDGLVAQGRFDEGALQALNTHLE